MKKFKRSFTAILFQRIFLILFKKFFRCCFLLYYFSWIFIKTCMFYFEWIFWIFLLVFLFLLQDKKVLFSQWGGGLRLPTPRRGLSPLRPWTRSLPPYILSFPLHTRPSRIGGGGFSSPCVYSLCRTLHTELHKKTYATRAYFFTHSGDRCALVRKVILNAHVA